MLYTLIVRSSYLQDGDKALEFAEQAISKGDQFNLIYFLFDGVFVANKFIDMPTDEPDLHKLWTEFATNNHIDLTVCAASGLRRGITEQTMGEKFHTGSIGQFIEACEAADKVITL